jgi:hypothetical protein
MNQFYEDVGKWLSRLTFIQEITGSSPVVLTSVVCSLIGKASHCECEKCQFKSGQTTFFDCGIGNADCGFNNPKSKTTNPKSLGAVAERRMHFTVYEDDDGSSPFNPVFFGHLAETD